VVACSWSCGTFTHKQGRVVERLDGIGFEWDVAVADAWERQFGELQAYQADKGDCNVPQRWPENPQLGTWVHQQRTEKRKFDRSERARITPERIERLDGIGFEWHPVANLWDQRFGELQAYQADKGHCNVPRQWRDNPQLGVWVNNQRVEKRKFDQSKRAKIRPEHVGRLDGIGFEWNPSKRGVAQRQQRHGASASRRLDAPRSPTRGGNGGVSEPATSSGSRQRPSRQAGKPLRRAGRRQRHRASSFSRGSTARRGSAAPRPGRRPGMLPRTATTPLAAGLRLRFRLERTRYTPRSRPENVRAGEGARTGGATCVLLVEK